MRWFRIDIDRWEEILITITRNKSRSLLTAFGIFWGIFMLVTLMGGSQGLHDILAANFEGFATNSGFTFNNRTSVAYQGFQEGRWWSMELKDIDRVRKAIPEIDIIAPTNSKWGITATFEKREITGCSMKGVYPEYEEIETPTLSMGRYINHIDIQQNRKVCIIGKQIYETLFPEGGNPCGKYVNVNGNQRFAPKSQRIHHCQHTQQVNVWQELHRDLRDKHHHTQHGKQHQFVNG